MSVAAPRAPTAEWVTACFHILDDGTRKCKLCPQKYKKETGTSNLRAGVRTYGRRRVLGRHSDLAEQSVVPKGKVIRQREEREKQRKERRQ